MAASQVSTERTRTWVMPAAIIVLISASVMSVPAATSTFPSASETSLARVRATMAVSRFA
ncbi:Uncharacterised protein [Mycobacteroides abscessus subsp. abscessus]|nr:Uncharacterised protein [Mycobacteroides abscessus subsp. abscessus]